MWYHGCCKFKHAEKAAQTHVWAGREVGARAGRWARAA